MTKQKNRFLLTYIDLSTWYPDAVPLQTTTSKEVANALLHIFSRLSVPLEILMDRGANFILDFMKEVCKFMGIRHIKTAPYHPQSNGCLEHFHHSLMQMLRKCKDEDIDWDTELSLFFCLSGCSFLIHRFYTFRATVWKECSWTFWMYFVISGAYVKDPEIGNRLDH